MEVMGATAAQTKHNRGVLPQSVAPYYESGTFPETGNNAPEESQDFDLSDEQEVLEPTYSHARYPDINRRAITVIMMITAAMGMAAGALLPITGKLDAQNAAALSLSLSGEFGEIFLSRAAVGAAFLAAEYILGFFAAGDILVWTAPMICSMGWGIRVFASEEWKLLPAAIVSTVVTALGASSSAGFSQAIMRVLRGGNIRFEGSPRAKLTLSFLMFLAVETLCALYEAIILTV